MSEAEVDLANVSTEEIIEAMRNDLNMLASVALPDEFDKPYSESHIVMWDLMTTSVQKEIQDEAIFDRFALGLPRGHAKTTMLKLLCLYIILFTSRRYVLVVCSNFTKASSFVGDILALLNAPNIIKLFGSWSENVIKDNDKIRSFTFKGRTIILQPAGIGSSIRGTSQLFQRPDIIICDDIQEREDAENVELAKKLLNWFLATLLKARNLRRNTTIYLGNMYKDLEIEPNSGVYCCLLRNLQMNSEWTSMIVGAILSNGQALWEEVVSLNSLLSDLRQDKKLGKEDIFYAESMNDPRVRMTKYYNPAKVPELPYNKYDRPVGKFLMIDPSLGTKKSDEQAVGLFYVYDAKGPVLKEIKVFQVSAPALVQQVITWAISEGVPLVCAEAAGYQATLLQWFVFFAEQVGLEGVEFLPVTPKGMSKVSRILAYLKSLMAGNSMVEEEPKALVDYQAGFYDPLKAKNIDDILDVGAYGEQVFIQYSSELLLPLEADFSGEEDAEDLENYPEIMGNIRLPN